MKAKFLYDEKGKKVGIFLPIKKYETMKKHLAHMEDLEDTVHGIISVKDAKKSDEYLAHAKKIIDGL